jgi:regulation of enolase protein 1 (concanavalin A-like superfamily)
MNELIHSALPFPLAPAGGRHCTFAVDAAGTLTLTGEARSDLFHDPAGGDHNPDAGFLVGVPPQGDFTLSARVTVPFAARFDAGVLLIWSDEDNFAKACFELSPHGEPMAVSVVTRRHSDDSNAFTVEDGDSLWLRLTRTGPAWAFHTSADGTRWDMLRYFTLDEPAGACDSVRVGFLAQSPAGDGITVTFAQIAYSEGAPKNLRDGS